METPDCNWKQGAIERVALEVIKEQKLKRRWGIFFKTFFLICLTFIIGYLVFEAQKAPHYDFFGRRMNDLSKGRIALVRLSGEISAYRIANAETLSKLLRQAISDKGVKGLLLLANSPGGSPVQSSGVYQTIRALKKQYQKPILTVVADRCASGCYYIASATDEIYADKSSVVGSIGVIFNGYGYSEAAEKLGIDLRTFTAGKNKDIMNPARPLTAQDVAFVKSWLDNTHQNFITAVKEGRGKRLSDNPDLFSGLFWVGDEAKDLGLVDGFATPLEVSQKIGNYPVYDYTEQDTIDKVLKEFGMAAKKAIGEVLNQVLSPITGIELK